MANGVLGEYSNTAKELKIWEYLSFICVGSFNVRAISSLLQNVIQGYVQQSSRLALGSGEKT